MKHSTYYSIVSSLLLTSGLIVINNSTIYATINSQNLDFNNDTSIDTKDLAILKANILLASSDSKYDVNGDTKINVIDYIMLSKMIIKLPLTDNTNITVAFTDTNFKNEIYTLIGKNVSVPILYSDIKNILKLDINSKNIGNLNGIEYFTSLTSLDCKFNQLTTLNISNNIALNNLYCTSNQLTTLYSIKNTWSDDCYKTQFTDASHAATTDSLVITVPNSTDITSAFTNANFKTAIYSLIGKTSANPILYSDVKDLKTLDVHSMNINSLSGIEYFTALNSLDCSSNQLTTLDISKNTILTSLKCDNNQLSTLDISKNISLTSLKCDNNQLSTLDISKNVALTSLKCDNNQLSILYSIKNTWTDDCYKTQFTDSSHTITANSLVITIPDLSDITSNFADENFKNFVYSLIGKVSPAPILYSDVKNIFNLDISSKNISNLSGIECFTSLTSLKCDSNNILTLNLSKNTLLVDLNCNYNNLTTLELNKNTLLTSLKCDNNKLSTLDISKNIDLTSLSCRYNQLATLDVSNNIKLTDIYCTYNQLATLYSIKNTWTDDSYKTQYADVNHTATTDNLVITIPDSTDITNRFTDENFKTAVYNLIGKSNTDSILYSDVKDLKTLTINSMNISSLSGIEYFTGLTSLDCSDNQLITIDLSKNIALSYLNCTHNQLTTLDINKNIALTYLNCTYNQLTILDVSKNIALTYLDCTYNQLTTLDVSKNIALSYLNCTYNQLTTFYYIKDTLSNDLYKTQFIDLSHTVTIDSLVITIPDFADITSIFTDENFKNYIYSLIGKTSPAPIFYSDVKNISKLDINSNNISSLSGIEDFTALTSLKCDSNNLITLDLSKNTSLTDLSCNNNNLTTLDLSKNTLLAYLSCNYNSLTSLDLGKNTLLTNLDCSSNKLIALDLSTNIALSSLKCDSNSLTILDLITSTSLIDLDCSSNKLTTLDLINNIALASLKCDSNNITSLDLITNTLLTYLSCNYNNLTTLDLNKNILLTYLDCSYNSLSTLDVLNNTALIDLSCNHNNLTTIYSIKNTWADSCYKTQYTDVSHTTTTDSLVITTLDSTDITNNFTDANFKAVVYSLIGKTIGDSIFYSDVKDLKTLTLNSMNISSLSGIEYFTTLTSLDCSGNQLTTLDISKNIALTDLDCSSNQLTTLYSIKNTWGDSYYKTQYTDAAHTATTNSLVITIPDFTDITSNFTDSNFKDFIYSLIGKVSPAPILYSDVKNVLKLDINSKNISSLSGIEYFTALTSLKCDSNNLEILDLNKNTLLTYLSCNYNNLPTLDLSNNTSLTYLDCSYTKLMTLNVSNNTALTYLDCRFNQLTTLDVSKNIALTDLYCTYNQLTAFYSIKNTWSDDLYKIQFTDLNQMTTTDNLTITIPDLADITSIFTDENFKNYVYSLIEKASPAPILYSDVKNILKLDINSKNISSLNGIEHFTALASLKCDSNNLITLNLNKNTLLTDLSCNHNNLSTLDLSENVSLTDLSCNYNNLLTLDLSKNISLTNLDCSYAKLTNLDVSNNTALTYLNCSYNQLTTLHSIKNTWGDSYYKTQYIDESRTTTSVNLVITIPDSTDITNNFTDANFKNAVYNFIGQASDTPILYSYVKDLKSLDIHSMNISSLSGIEYFTSLNSLDCSYNQLTTLDISKNAELTDLNCSYNEIKTFYTIKNTWSTDLYKTQFMDSSQTTTTDNLVITIPDLADITSIFTDVNFKNYVYSLIEKASPAPILYSDVKNILKVDINSKNISSLDGLEHFTTLTSLKCDSNNLTTLNLNKNTSLTDLSCNYNNLSTLDLSENVLLTNLSCNYNNLLTLDLSKNILLTNLDCSYAKLTNLDISNNTALTYLNCRYNQLTTLYSIKNTWGDSYYKPQYTDESHTTTSVSLVITILDSTDITNNFTDANFKNAIYNFIGQSSGNPILYSYIKDLKSLDIHSMNISSLSGIEYFTALNSLDCSYNQLSTLDISKNVSLTDLNCSYNEIKTLYTIKNTWSNDFYKTQFVDSSHTTTTDSLVITISDLEDITNNFTDTDFKAMIYSLIGKTSVDSILYSDVKNISKLDINSKNISSLNGIEYFTGLTSLKCASNNLTTLDLTKNTLLTYLDCSNTNITILDLSKNTSLTDLDCSYTKLSTLDLITNTSLTYLNCKYNQLTTLDVSKNILLIYLDCTYNQLTTFYYIKNIWLDSCYKTQYTDANHIDTINSLVITIPDLTDMTNNFTDLNFKSYIYSLIGKASASTILYSDIKNILTIDINSKNISNLSGIEYFTALTSLKCASNNLTTMDLSKNTSLTYLACNYNNITALDLTKNTLLADLDCDSTFGMQLPIQTKVTSSTSLFSTDFQGNTAPTNFINGAFTINNGLQSPTIGSASTIAYYNVYSTLDRQKVRARVKIVDVNSVFALIKYSTVHGAVGEIDCANKKLRLFAKWTGGALPTEVINQDITIPIISGREYSIIMEKNGSINTLTILDTVTNESNSVTYDNSKVIYANSSGKSFGGPGVMFLQGNILVKSLEYINPVSNPYAVILGDSITEGFGLDDNRGDFNDRWCSLLNSSVNNNCIISGRGAGTSADLIDRIPIDLNSFRPKYVIVLIGTNDTSLDIWKTNINTIVTDILSIGSTPILCVPPSGTLRVEQANYLRTLAYKVIGFDYATTINNNGATMNLSLFSDGCHPNKLGHLKMFDQFKIDAPYFFN